MDQVIPKWREMLVLLVYFVDKLNRSEKSRLITCRYAFCFLLNPTLNGSTLEIILFENVLAAGPPSGSATRSTMQERFHLDKIEWLKNLESREKY